MASSENTRKIVVDSSGRITALGVTKKRGEPDEISIDSLPLKIGDRIAIRVATGDKVERASTKDAHKRGKVYDHNGMSALSVGDIHPIPPKMPFERITLPNRKPSSIAEDAATVRKTSPLMKHAIETFGSEKAAREWMSVECGALNNKTPAEFIKSTGDVAEVDRILGCIDYGIIA